MKTLDHLLIGRTGDSSHSTFVRPVPWIRNCNSLFFISEVLSYAFCNCKEGSSEQDLERGVSDDIEGQVDCYVTNLGGHVSN